MPMRGSDATTCATRTFSEGSAPGIAAQFPSLLPGFVPIDGGGQIGGNFNAANVLPVSGADGAHQAAGGGAEGGGHDSSTLLAMVLARLDGFGASISQVQEQTAYLADQSNALGITWDRASAA